MKKSQIYIDDSGTVHVSYPCDSCSEWVHTEDHCGDTLPDGTDQYMCGDCYGRQCADQKHIHDWLLFLGEDNPIGCDIAIHKSMVGRRLDSADCSTPDPEEGVTRFGPGSLSLSMTNIDDLHFDVHHVHTLWDKGYLNDECINIFKAQGGE